MRVTGGMLIRAGMLSVKKPENEIGITGTLAQGYLNKAGPNP